MPSGDAIANFSIACTEKWKDKNSGEWKEATEWIRISAFGKLAEICIEYLKKGSKVYIEGKFKTRQYEQDGVTKYTTEIRLENMLMLDGRPAGGDSEGGERRERPASNGSGSTTRQQPRQGTNAGSAGGYGGGGGFDDMSDDIPFQNPYNGVMQGLAALGF